MIAPKSLDREREKNSYCKCDRDGELPLVDFDKEEE